MTKFLELEQQSNFMAEPLQTNPGNSKEVDDDMIEPTASLEPTPPVPYDVRTEGPITYFHYYFEEDGATIEGGTDSGQHSAAKFSPNRYLVGAGVLTATALSGLAVAEMSKAPVAAKPHAPQATVQQNAPAIGVTKRPNLIGTAVQPLPVNQPLWSNQASPQLSKPLIAKPTIGTTPQRSLNDESQQRLVIDQPNSIGKAVKILPFKPLALPKTTGGMSVISKPEPVATLSQTGLQPKPVNLSTPQPVQPLPNPQSLSNTSLSNTSSKTALPTVMKRTPGSQAAGIALPETLAPQTADASTRLQSLVPLPTQAATDRQNVSNPASETNAATESGAANAQSALPQSMQDLLNRSRPSLTDKRVTIIPLTQKAAEDVLAINKAGLVTEKAGRFTILHLNLQDYQQAWMARNKATQQPALMDAFPTYGFVDYQAQIIAVLDQQQPLRPSLQVGMLTPAR